MKTTLKRKLTVVVMLFALLFIGQACRIQQLSTSKSFQTHDSGIKYRISEAGKGEKAEIDDIISVHYILKLQDSTVVDNSYERGEPVFFKVGSGQVIKGWDIAMKLLREGDKAELIIPPGLAYNDSRVGDIPPGSTLYFEVELLGVEKTADPLVLDDNVSFTETPSGLKYAVVKPGKGIRLRSGMQVRIHYTGYFEDMSSFDSSFNRGRPIDFTLGKGMVIKGWEEGLANLRVGDHARFWIPYELAYGKSGRGPIPPESNLIFDVEVVDAQEAQRPEPFRVESKDTLQTDSGLQYIIIEKGSVETPETGQMVRVHYTGFLPNGTIFDSSVERAQPFQFVLGRQQVIGGWDEGVALMGQGARYRFIIPPELGYGSRAVGPIPANTTLIFDIELLDFK